MNKYSRQPGDSILALLEPGEYVLNRNAVDEIGKENLDELNFEDAPRFDMSQRGQFQAGGMLGDMMGYQTGGTLPESYLVNKGPQKQKKGKFSREYIFELPTDEGNRFYSGKAKSDRRATLEQFGTMKSLQDALMKMETTPADSIPSGDVEKYFDKKGLKGILGGILGMQAGGSTLSYGGATTEVQSLDDIYKKMGMEPIDEQREKFEEQYAYDPTREGVIFEDYGRAITGATQSGRQNLLGAGQQMRQAQGKSGFAGGGAGQQAQQQARSTIMQDFLAQEGAAKSSLFKGVRSERDAWMSDVGAGLSTLQSQEGTQDYGGTGTTTGTTTDSNATDPFDPSDTGPPGWPSVQAFNQWMDSGADPNTKTLYGWQDPGNVEGYDPTKPYSDVRLKKDINYLFTMNNGVPIYKFKYKWSDDVSIGTMAQDIEDMIPEAVSHDSNGYKMVNYSKVFNYGKI